MSKLILINKRRLGQQDWEQCEVIEITRIENGIAYYKTVPNHSSEKVKYGKLPLSIIKKEQNSDDFFQYFISNT